MAANSETEAASRARMSRRVAAYLEQTAQAVPPSISGSASFAFNEPRRMPIFDDRAGSRWSERATEQHSRLFRDDMAAPINEVQYGRASSHQYALDASPRPAEPVRSSEDTNTSGSAKRSRYLREADRRSIIRRIAGGEKQAALAREFGVTRAAICHINKNRVEILARSIHADVRHPKRALYQTISKPMITQSGNQDDRSQLPIVYEVRSLPMTILVTALRNKETKSREFRHFADRAIRLLLEEALACVETKTIELVTPSECVCEGVQAVQTSCGVAVGEDAFPMLESFRAIHYDSPTGYVSLDAVNLMRESDTSNRFESATVNSVQLPPNLERHSVFLMMPTCPTGLEVCASVQTLLDYGAQEASIFFVCLVTSAFAASDICNRYPAVRIVTAAIDPDVNEIAICPGIGDFRSRYFNSNSGNIVVSHDNTDQDATRARAPKSNFTI